MKILNLKSNLSHNFNIVRRSLKMMGNGAYSSSTTTVCMLCIGCVLGELNLFSLNAQETIPPAAPATSPQPPSEDKPAAPAPVEGKDDATAKPKKPVLNFEHADLRVILQAMAKQAGISLIVPEDVTGTVTARLVDVPVEKAMRTILESRGYSLIEIDGVYQVKSKEAIEKEPTKTEIYTFANASAKEAKPTLDKLLTKAGNAQLDERSNTLVITDVPSNLAKVMPILKTLDDPIKQVLIEAKLLEITRNPRENIGIDWSEPLAGYRVAAQGVQTATVDTDGVVTTTFGGWRGHITDRIPTGSPGNAINNKSPGVKFQQSLLGIFGAGYPVLGQLAAPEFAATLSFLLRDQDTELLASPKVITTDNKEAKIRIARQQPIPNFTFNQQTASFALSGFEFKDIGNLLTVTPHVNKDNFITLDVTPEVSSSNDSQTFNLTGGAAGNVTIPIIDIRTLTSRVMVKSGNTLALGGLLQNNQVRSFTKVPFLGDIPLIGEIFRSHAYTKTKRNLLIFITPNVVGSDGTGLEDQYAKLREDPNDRFPYAKNFIGNAKPRDQFGGPESPFDTQATGANKKSEMIEEEIPISYPTAVTTAQPAASEEVPSSIPAAPSASEDQNETPPMEQQFLEPRISPGLRE